ncbi:RIP metalloprotease RseP [Pedobacter changchengzhani]|uniref:Zinc metalloprotease n=1 Tax=Pedobacter changchengzhani TaxID=2529274 RepID=A0A4R5MMM1_9SPHI|nr:RIP metalloprotease RseP [Pedobacter changchengzhani]TDG36379.1 RIP metalloprotease RseP [Pedobacter changchengzhani]
MNGLIMAGQLLLGLSLLVILHELGHFLAARAFGIKVEKFYLFFDAWGFKLFSFKKGGVEYGVGWLPLGGYVKIAGMIDESMDTEQLAQPAQPWEFRSKPAWQRLIVMLGGIFVNIIVGIFIFWMLTFKYGQNYVVNDKLVDGISVGSIGKEIGLQTGDRVLAINGKKLIRFDDLLSTKVLFGDAQLTVLRGEKTLYVAVPDTILNKITKNDKESFIAPRFRMGSIREISVPDEKADAPSFMDKLLKRKKEKPVYPAFNAGIKPKDSVLSVNGTPIVFFDQFKGEISKNANKEVSIHALRNGQPIDFNLKVNSNGTIGVIPNFNSLATAHVNFGFFESLPEGSKMAYNSFLDNAKGISKMITGKLSARNISSPVGIAQAYGGTFDWVKFWTLTGLISMALAFMNLLPIPGLDGGHVVFLLIEMVQRKPVSEKVLEKAQIVGFVILISLMVYAFGNDIFKAFGK